MALSPQGSPAVALHPELLPGALNSLLAEGGEVGSGTFRFSSHGHWLCLPLAWARFSESENQNSQHLTAASELSSLTLSFHRVRSESLGPPYLQEGGRLGGRGSSGGLL